MRHLLASLAALLLLAGRGGGGSTDGEGGNVGWPRWGNTAENTHFADLDQVDRGNVARLRVAWTRPGGQGQDAWETFPIVVGRTMYYDTGVGEVFAVDAATGRVRCSYTAPVDFLAGPQLRLAEPVNRGVAYGAGRIYLTTADDQLIALDARTGKPAWKTRAADPERGNTMNSPGVFWEGELIVGGPAGDAGLRGFVVAYDAATGRQLWRTHVIPPPGKGWRRARGAHGGGDVWMPPVVDPQSGTAYVSTGNPTPGFTDARRPGCNPLADATVALDAKTGRIEWGHTEVCDDSWDYDTVQAPTVLDLRRPDGETVRAVGAGSKSGFWSTLDATTGRLLARSPYITRYSRPHLRPTRRGAVVCPATGEIRWRVPLPRPSNGGVLATAGGVILVGDDDGYLYALDDRSGKVLWRHDLQRRVGSAPIAYEIEGVEYIAIAAGGSLVEAKGTAPDRPARLFVFRLDG